MLPKPPKGTARKLRTARKRREDAIETANKATARVRDVHCRWPACGCHDRPWLEAAHLRDKSLGGSNETGNLILLCQRRHQGTISLHGKRCRIVPLTDAGTDGLCEFWQDGVLVGVN